MRLPLALCFAMVAAVSTSASADILESSGALLPPPTTAPSGSQEYSVTYDPPPGSTPLLQNTPPLAQEDCETFVSMINFSGPDWADEVNYICSQFPNPIDYQDCVEQLLTDCAPLENQQLQNTMPGGS